MRHWLNCGCVAVALQASFVLPAAALTTPEQMRPDEARGDDRVRQVWWKPGMVIKLEGAEGQSLMVEMPKGMELQAFMFSLQNIIKPDEYLEVDPVTGKPIPPPVVAKEEGCEGNINIKICVRRERFLFFIPYVRLATQPLPVVMIEKKKIKTKVKGKDQENSEEIEYPIVFELSTVDQYMSPYYSVKVNMGDPPPPPAPPLPPVVAPIAPVPPPKPVPTPAPKTVPMARRGAPAHSPVTPLPPMNQPAETASTTALPLSVPRETAEPRIETAQERADRDVKELLANRQNRTPIVPIPPRPGMSEADKAQLRELERIATQPISRPRINDKYNIQGDPNLLGR